MVYGTQHVLYYSGHMVRRSTGRDVRLSGRMVYGTEYVLHSSGHTVEDTQEVM